MVTLHSLGVTLVTLVGNEDGLIIRLNVSLVSSMLSLDIEILNKTLVCPAGMVIKYGPEL